MTNECLLFIYFWLWNYVSMPCIQCYLCYRYSLLVTEASGLSVQMGILIIVLEKNKLETYIVGHNSHVRATLCKTVGYYDDPLKAVAYCSDVLLKWCWKSNRIFLNYIRWSRVKSSPYCTLISHHSTHWWRLNVETHTFSRNNVAQLLWNDKNG